MNSLTNSPMHSMFSLADKISIVTGAGSGIGAAIAEAFASQGSMVYLADRDETAANSTRDRILQNGGQAKTHRTDITSQQDCLNLVETVLRENHNRCDTLVNNAGIGHVGTILNTTPDDLSRLWEVNLMGAYRLCQAILPSMIQQAAGSIINIGSIASYTGMENRLAYVTTKHAMLGLTRSIAMDLGPSGVRINCICPGRVQTPFVDARLKEYPNPDEYLNQLVAPHTLKRVAQPAEIAAAAVYLASDASAFVTGSAMTVDGGYTAGK
jgi:NAD(P)-dependent dehydrogenase (short-subunit alcohol dehydrogenase family)